MKIKKVNKTIKNNEDNCGGACCLFFLLLMIAPVAFLVVAIGIRILTT